MIKLYAYKNSCPPNSHVPKSHALKSHRGAALLIVISVVAMVAIIATAMLREQYLAIRQTEQTVFSQQALLMVFGAENWARDALTIDYQKNQTDSEHDDWNKPLPITKVDGGNVSAQLSDLQARLNLNNLVQSGKAEPLAKQRLTKLFKALTIKPAIIEALVDWLDANSIPQPQSGAEDDYYSRLHPPYRAANAPLTDLSELRLIRGMENQDLSQLQTTANTLPVGTSVNINSCPALVFQALGLDSSQTEQILQQRQTQPFETLDDFINALAEPRPKLDLARLSVNSHYFLLTTTVNIGTVNSRWYSLFIRNDKGQTTLVRRSRTQI